MNLKTFDILLRFDISPSIKHSYFSLWAPVLIHSAINFYKFGNLDPRFHESLDHIFLNNFVEQIWAYPELLFFQNMLTPTFNDIWLKVFLNNLNFIIFCKSWLLCDAFPSIEHLVQECALNIFLSLILFFFLDECLPPVPEILNLGHLLNFQRFVP